MLFRRWHNGHSLGAGVLGGLLLAEHAWTVAVLAFALGLTAGLFLHLLGAGAERLREGVVASQRKRRGLVGLERDLVLAPPFNSEIDDATRTPW